MISRIFVSAGLLFSLILSLQGQVIISEFQADNKSTLADEDLTFPDWIELYNTNSTPINLSGWALTDDSTHTVNWVFPSTNINARGFLVVFASGKNRSIPGRPLHTSFNIRAAGEYLALLKPDGSVAQEFAPAIPEQYPDFSYGISLDVKTNVLLGASAAVKYKVPTDATLGTVWKEAAFDDSAWASGRFGVGYETAVAGFAVYNYLSAVAVNTLADAYNVLANPGQQLAVYSENAAVLNYVNISSSAHYGNDAPFPGLTIGVDQNDFVVRATATITIPAAGNWTFGVNSDDGFSLTVGGNSMSYPNPRGPADTLQTFNFAQAGTYPLELVYYERGGGAALELFAAQGSFASWNSTGFNLVGAPGGLQVSSQVVSGGGGGGGGGSSYRTLIQTDVQAAMSGVNPTAYVRSSFDVADPSVYQSLTLRVMYDDGFVAYLNGREVARRNAPATPAWNSSATGSHPNVRASIYEDINISENLGALMSGRNVLAIQGLNESAGDTDFLISASLVEYQGLGETYKYFSKPSPGVLNGSGYVAFVKDTRFSVDRGFFDTPFSLSITSATAGATIIYTTNGSVPTISNGMVYSGPITIRGTTVMRAAGFKEGFYPSDVDTQTYLFLNDVIRQSSSGQAPPGWPSSWGQNVVDYGMDPDIVNSAAYSAEIIPALKSIPTFSIVTDLKNLFDPSTGIYANAGQDGIEWERPASLELIYPDGTKGFQSNAGIRIRGGYSRSSGNPKHAFRIFFRSEYGNATLNFPLFAKQNGTTSFDSFDLRTFQNYSWSFEGDYRFVGLRDQFNRDAQLAMGHQAERGDFYHLYIDGQYWGVFNTDERPEASFAESYYGGNKEDYDVVKVDTTAGYNIIATDGNLSAWLRVWQAATNGFSTDASYYRVQGLNLDGTRNPAYENLLDIDNLIDYELLAFFVGNIDAPVSAFLGNDSPNNMYAIRNRTDQYGGFRFFSHDGEHTLHHESTLTTTELYRDRTMPFAAGDPISQGASTAFAKSNPHYFFTRLSTNAEFRLRVADHVQRAWFNGGVFTTEACRQRFQSRSNEIYSAVVAESARWGDSKVSTPRTRNIDWKKEMDRIVNDYFVQRPGIVLSQIKARNLFPNVAAPAFNQNGGNVQPGFALTMSALSGTIYYTQDGSDPRLRGGAVSPGASVYSGAISLSQSAIVRARVLSGTTWSALMEAKFYVVRDFTGLMLTEVMYHPAGTTNVNADDYEFIELKNVTGSTMELSGLRFTNGIQYTFPIGKMLAPGSFVILASNPAVLTNRYPTLKIDGAYTNRLSNSGETLSLVHVDGKPIFSMTYGTRPPWPELADGTGFSLVPTNPNLNPDPNDPLNWRASALIGGSPGADDAPLNIPRILVSEALTHTDPPQVDWIELYNPYSTNVDVGGWYLTDDRSVPQKFRIPAGTVIPALGYKAFTETEWNSDPDPAHQFRLNSHGEQVYVFSGDANGALTGYSDGFSFGGAQNGVSFGRYVNSVGDIQYPAQIAPSSGAPNIGPRVGPVVINEIFYNPPLGGDEFVELKSITNVVVKLYDPEFPTNTWVLKGTGFKFPTGAELAPNGLVLVVATDPAAFRTKYGVPANVPIYGPFAGALQGSETLSLECPDKPDIDLQTGLVVVPYFDVDVVHYGNRDPWPTAADGFGGSLERLKANAYGNDPVNWRASIDAPSPGLENAGNRAPRVDAGADQVMGFTTFPAAFVLGGFVLDDGLPAKFVSKEWTQVSGPAGVWFSDASATNATVFFPGTGRYVLRLSGSDGELQTSDTVEITVQRPVSLISSTLIAKGSTWKYLDDGSDQGTAWRAAAFNDITWNSGPAPLGYGDANGIWPATTNSFGPNANAKYITTYYRRAFSVAEPSTFTNLTMSVQRDDGFVAFLNGTPVFTNNMPVDSGITYLTPAATALGGVDESAFVVQGVDPKLLVKGANTVAVEIHQSAATSSDIIFDLELSGESLPVNAGPTANAGPDQTVSSAVAWLNATVTDDGLPVSSGMLTFAWSKVSGPGTVTFSAVDKPVSTATFSTAGTYVLRLSVSDGALSTTDELIVTVQGSTPPPAPTLLPIEIVNGSVQLRFNAAAGASYTLQYCDALQSDSWKGLTDVPAGEARLVMLTDPVQSAARYYRLISPAQ